MINHHKRKVSV